MREILPLQTGLKSTGTRTYAGGETGTARYVKFKLDLLSGDTKPRVTGYKTITCKRERVDMYHQQVKGQRIINL
jgi:hypothetical protein